MKTDTQLQQDVIAELKWEPSIDAAQIGVEVKDGIVTLAGHVNSYAEKWDAERAAQRVSGVKALAMTPPALVKRHYPLAVSLGCVATPQIGILFPEPALTPLTSESDP